MEKIGTGRTAEVFLTEEHTALKLFYEWVSAAHVHNEVERAEVIGSLYPDAPRFIRSGKWDGRAGLEMEYIAGEMGTDYLARNPLRIRELIAKVAAVHKEMHRIEAPVLSGQMEKFAPGIFKCPYLADTTREKLQAFLQDREDMPFLCHGDFHPENIVVTTKGRFRIIDWLDAYRGDPMGDVARTYYLVSGSESPNPNRSFSEKMLMRMRRFIAEQYLRCYYQGEKILEKDWLTWQLIILTGRLQEGIEAEKPRIHQMILHLDERIFKEEDSGGRK